MLCEEVLAPSASFSVSSDGDFFTSQFVGMLHILFLKYFWHFSFLSFTVIVVIQFSLVMICDF